MLLSDLPRNRLFKKIRVWNAGKTQKGWTTAIFPEGREDITIEITWDNGNKSDLWHFECDRVEIIPEECDLS